jgi:hypothetical protein
VVTSTTVRVTTLIAGQNIKTTNFMKGTPMSRLLNICLTLILAMSIGFAQGINGKWKGQMESPNGPMELTFTFTVSGDSLTGTVESPMGELPISNGKIAGKTFTFDVSVGEMMMNHRCTFLTDSISLKVPGMQGENMEMILKRLPDVKKELK